MRRDQILSVVRESAAKKMVEFKDFCLIYILSVTVGALKYEIIRQRKLNLVEQKCSLMVKYTEIPYSEVKDALF